MVLPCYWARLCCIVKTPQRAAVEDFPETDKNKSGFQSQRGLMPPYLRDRCVMLSILKGFLEKHTWNKAHQLRIWYMLQHYAEINVIYCITTPFYEFSAWVESSIFLSWLGDLLACLARSSGEDVLTLKCWQEWSSDVPDGMAHMQCALWPGRLMNTSGSESHFLASHPPWALNSLYSHSCPEIFSSFHFSMELMFVVMGMK